MSGGASSPLVPSVIDMEELQQRTRALGFDFDRVAVALSTPQTTYTAAECRLAYAASFLPPTVAAAAATAATTAIIATATKPLATAMMPDDVMDGMSFREMMDVIAARQERNDRRKEKIFSRVLAALGPGAAGIVAEDSSELQLIKAQMAERKKRREHDAALRDKEKKELEEARWLQVRVALALRECTSLPSRHFSPPIHFSPFPAWAERAGTVAAAQLAWQRRRRGGQPIPRPRRTKTLST